MTATQLRQAFGWRLRQARTMTGKSQLALANELGVTAAVVGHWEVGRNGITLSRLREVAILLHCSVDYLMGFTDKNLPHGQLMPAGMSTCPCCKGENYDIVVPGRVQVRECRTCSQRWTAHIELR